MAPSLSVAEQVQLMLAKAESTTPAEAEMIMARAEKLMIRHGLSEAMIAAASPEAQKEEIVSQWVHFTGVYADAHSVAGVRIAEAFGTMRGLISGKGTSRSTCVVGHESDVERAVTLINSLTVQAVIAEKAWRQSEEGKATLYWLSRQATWKARRQFFVAFGNGAASRIREETRVAVAETGPGNALVLVDRKTLVEAEMPNMFGKLGRSRSFESGSRAASAAGHAAGRNANINTNRKAVQS
jgi:hypothetical protein